MDRPCGSTTYGRQLELRANHRRPNANAIKELASAPEFPADVAHLWALWRELRKGIRSGMNGLERPSWGDLRDWRDMTRRDPPPHVLTALIDIDDGYRTGLYPPKVTGEGSAS